MVSTLGLSNYHACEVERCFSLCDSHGLTKPKVFQGLYNPLNRVVEDELLPLLRANDCSFIAYNGLAAGLLTGRHTYTTNPDEIAAGRFKNNPNYIPRFFTKECFAALENIRRACEASSLSMVHATYQWLLRHSALGHADGVLIGASLLKQLDDNLAACSDSAPALTPLVIDAFNDAWEGPSGRILKDSSYPYWRSYSSDHPKRDNLPPGAG